MISIEEYAKIMNGDLYVHNDGGEADEWNAQYVVEVPNTKDPMNYADLTAFFCNTVARQIPTATSRQKTLVVAVRLLAFRAKLFLPGVDAKRYHARYNEAVFVDVPDEEAVKKVPMPDWYDRNLASAVAKQFTNLVCFTAYIFRWRGHHYLDSYDQDIENKWNKNTNAASLNLRSSDLKFIMTNGLHAIFPEVLDNYWIESVSNSLCCRPFALRVHVPCAGTAVFYAILAGVDEVKLIAIQKDATLADKMDKLRVVVDRLRAERWLGGINRVYYGGAELDASESDFAILAACVYGINTPDTGKTALGHSKSLERVASGAHMITLIYRAVASGMVRRAGNSEATGSLGDRALKSLAFMDTPKARVTEVE